MQSEHAKLPLWKEKSFDEKLEALRKLVDDLYVYTLAPVRQELLEILSDHQPFDEKESFDLVKIREMIEKFPNICNKNCEPGHITGSALVMDLNTGRVLLHHHKSLNRLLQFGGHSEHETDFALVALREAREESGLPDLTFFPEVLKPHPLDIDVHVIPSAKGRPEHLHLDFRYLLVTRRPNELSVGSEESSNFLWLTLEEVKQRETPIYPPLMRFILKATKLYSVE